MILRYEKSGIHFHKDFLKARVDFIPEPTDKTYALHYVDHYDNEDKVTAEMLNDPAIERTLPRHKEVNPAFCHFITVPSNVTWMSLGDYLLNKFLWQDLVALDDILVMPRSPERADLRRAFLAPRSKMPNSLPCVKDRIDLVAVNQNLKAVDDYVNSKVVRAYNAVIIIGSRPAAMPQTRTARTIVDEVAADGTGTIDTHYTYYSNNATGVDVGTFIHEGSNVLSTRDWEAIGNVTAGSEQSFSVSLAVTLGDFLGEYWATGYKGFNNSSAIGAWYIGTDEIPCTSVSFSFAATNYDWWIYGEGTTGLSQAVGDGSIAIAGTLGRNIFIGAGSGAIAISGTLGRLTKISIGSGTVSIAGALSSIKTVLQAVGDGAITITGTLGRVIKIAVGDGSMTITGSLAWKFILSVGNGIVTIAKVNGKLIRNCLFPSRGGGKGTRKMGLWRRFK